MGINKMIRKLNERNAGIWILAGLLLCIVSCGDEQGYKKETLPPSTLTEATPLQTDTIALELDSFYAAKDYYVYNDSVLIVVNGKAQAGSSFIYIYDLADMGLIASYFRYGNGHNEVLSANVDLNNNTLFVNDFMKGQVAFINLDSVLALRDKYRVGLHKHNVYSAPTAVPYKDGYITENPYCFYDEESEVSQGVEQGVPRFIVTDGKENKEDFGGKFDINPRNVAVDGRIVCKPDGEGFVYASFGQSNVEFYDEDLNLKKIVKGPRELDTKYYKLKSDGFLEVNVIYDGKIPYCYLGYSCDDDFVYLMYLGVFYKSDADLKNISTYILKFDWSGNYIKGYKCDRYLSSISKGTEEDVFYATAINEDGLPFLIKLYVK